MTQQPTALRLADNLDEKPDSDGDCRQAAAELRRLHEVNEFYVEAAGQLLDRRDARIAALEKALMMTADVLEDSKKHLTDARRDNAIAAAKQALGGKA